MNIYILVVSDEYFAYPDGAFSGFEMRALPVDESVLARRAKSPPLCAQWCPARASSSKRLAGVPACSHAERHLCIRKSLLNNRLLLPHLRPRARCCAVHCPAKGRSGDASGNSNPTATECELRTRRVRWFHGSSASILIRNECPSPLKVQALTGRVGRQQNAQWIFRGIGVEPTLNVFAVRATREAINYLDALSPPVH